MNIKNPLVILLVMSLIVSCKKKNNESATGITLAPLVVSGNTVTLNWSRLTNNSLMYYTIVKVIDSTNPQSVTYITVDYNTTKYKDTLFMSPYAQYSIIGRTSSKSFFSNKETCTRSDIKFMAISPKDALYDQSSHLVYIYSDKGDIAVYDVQNKKSVSQIAATGDTIGYCDLGTYNGKKELYVPHYNGWLYIYDAATMTQTDKINVGSELLSVSYNNGILYFCSHYPPYIYSYSRTTKTVISNDYRRGNRMKMIQGSNSEFFVINDDFSNVFYTKFDNSGNYISQPFAITGSGNVSSLIFEISSDGNNIITSSSGMIFNKNLIHVSTLSQTDTFTTFDFDNTNHLIYAGRNSKVIQAYSMNDYRLTKTINTNGYPAKIFYDNGSIISVSTALVYQYPYPRNLTTYTFIEQF